MSTLLVIIPDRLSDIVGKGEITPRYYNPGNLFDEVHILMISDDRVEPRQVQRTVGDARLFIHNLPALSFRRSFSYHPWIMNYWAKAGIDLAEQIGPHLIRCHGNWLNGFVASRIHKKLHIPYIISMHINPDEDVRGRLSTAEEKKYWGALEKIEKISLKNAAMVLPVYQPIIPYLKRMGVSNFEVAYNVLNPDHLKKKDDYRLYEPVRLLSVGRHFKEKNPENIIRAVQKLPNTHLTLVGDGPYQQYLEDRARECNIEPRVSFIRAIPNDDLCKRLPEFDIFVVHTEYWEIGKSVLEPLLTGLPVVINRRKGQPVPELQGDHVLTVDNTPEGYFNALNALIYDDAMRERLGRTAYDFAQEHWKPERTEAKYVDIYRQVLQKHGISSVR